jgi:hypothetical protein
MLNVIEKLNIYKTVFKKAIIDKQLSVLISSGKCLSVKA